MKSLLIITVLICGAVANPLEKKPTVPKSVQVVPDQAKEAAQAKEEQKTVFVTAASQCPHDSGTLTGFPNRCVKVYTDAARTQVEAVAMCRGLGGDLLRVENGFQSSNLLNYLMTGTSSSVDQAWIGLSQLSNGTWQWTDGSSVGYTNWRPGQPSSGKKCGVVNIRNTEYQGTWDSAVCTSQQSAAVCEFLSCPSGWHQFASGPSRACFQYFSTSYARSWDSAESYCQTFSNNNITGHLASIDNAAQNTFVKRLPGLGTDSATSGCTQTSWPWIGLRMYSNGKNYYWSDGKPFAYANWAPTQPYGASSYQCVMMVNRWCYDLYAGSWTYPKQDWGQWATYPNTCGTGQPFVCKIDM